MNNLQAIQAFEKHALLKYFSKIADAKMHKLTLFSIFPYTAAPNLSDAHPFIILEDLTVFASLNSGKIWN